MGRLRTIRNVELLEVGEDWQASNGVFTFTPEDLLAAVSATEDPAVRTPVLKLGHVDPRFDGQPSFGRVDNLRISANGMTLIGDYVSVPEWLAEILPSAYPRRSIEGRFDYTTKTGRHHDFFLTGLALLGEAYPAITTLEDIEHVFGADAADEIEMVAASNESEDIIIATKVEASMPKWRKKKEDKVEAAATSTDVARSFYDAVEGSDIAGAGGWAWIRELYIDPPQLIVDAEDGEGTILRVPYAIKGDEVTFGDAVSVKVEYVDVADVAASAPLPKAALVYATKEESRAATVPEEIEQGDQGEKLDADQLKEKLNLPAEATQDEIDARLDEVLAQNEAAAEAQKAVGGETGTGDDAGSDSPAGDSAGTQTGETEGVVTGGDAAGGQTVEASGRKFELPPNATIIDKDVLASLQAGAQAGLDLQKEARAKQRDDLIEAAIGEGRIAPAQRDGWRNKFEAEGMDMAKAALGSLAKGLVPVAEKGHGGEVDASAADESSAYMSEAGRYLRSQGGQPNA